jgi:DNA processing protein
VALDDLNVWERDGITPVACVDPRYPAQLRGIADAPPLIFVRGALFDGDRDGVSIIGTRTPTPTGIRTARQLATELVGAGRTVMSGLAAGIDTAAHTAALAAGGRSVGVLGTGLQHAYPAANAGLQGRLHVLVSQFWPEQGPRRENFPMRNLLMSALSSATVIVEAGERSGARIQARHAIAQGRRLILMASLLSHEWARTLAPQAGVHIIDAPGELTTALSS